MQILGLVYYVQHVMALMLRLLIKMAVTGFVVW